MSEVEQNRYIDSIMFVVDPEGTVSLCVGPVQVVVCDHPDQFNDFADRLTARLNTIADEIKENYCE